MTWLYRSHKRIGEESFSCGRLALIVGSAILLLRVFAYQLMPESVATALLGLAILCLFVYLCGRRKLFFKQNIRCLVWLVPSIYTIINCIAFGKFTWALALLLVAVVSLMILPCGTDWIEIGYLVLVAVLMVFAVATVILFLFPSLYPSIKTAFFAGYHGATGYQSGLTTHYSVNGSLMALGLVLCASRVMFAEGGLKGKRLWLVLTLLFLFALLLTAKRGPLLSAVIGLLFAFLASDSKGKFSKFVVAAIVITCGTLILATFVPQVGEVFDRFSSFSDGASIEDTTSGRTNIWAEALGDWKTSPLLGIGWGRFVFTYPSGTLSVSLAHNELLHTLATLGVVGSVLFVAAELYSVYFTIRLAKNAPVGSSMRSYLYTSFAVQVLTLFYGYTSGGIVQLEYISVPYLLAVAVSFALANSDGQKLQHEKETSRDQFI